MLRSCYRTTMTFPGVGPVKVIWYFVDDKAPNLPYFTVYNSLNWDRQGDRDTSNAGEVRGAARPWYNGRDPGVECAKPSTDKDAWLGGKAPLRVCNPPELFHGALELGGQWLHGMGDQYTGEGGVLVDGSGRFGTGWRATGGVLADGVSGFGEGWRAAGGVLVDGSGHFGTGWRATGGVLVDGSGLYTPGWTGTGGVLVDGSGTFVSVVPDEMPIGAICYWGKTTPPAGWLLCDGSAVSQATYPALFALLGTTFGPAAGGNFTLPDLRSRIPIGTGTGAGLSAYALAATGGEETHTLVSGEMPSHTHAQDVNTVIGAGAALPVQASLSPNHALGGTTSSTGGGGSHNNIQPYLVLTAIIRAL